MIVFINPDPDYQTPEQVLDLVIENLLYESDWTQIADAPSGGAWTGVDKAAWATYRQQLRDVPAQSGFPANVTWPVKPE